MKTVLITGGTGLIGKALTAMLISKGYEVIILSRSARTSDHKSVSYASWDVEKDAIDIAAIQKADYIIHLAGAGVADKRWTKKRKQEILQSRTKSGELLIKTLRENENKVKAFISSSAIGWYGPDNDASLKTGFKEDAPSSDDFLGNTCQQWEQSTKPMETLGKRLVYLRTGIVLSNDGGALKEFKMPVKFGIAAILGGGKQMISWIHIEDICRMYIYALENEINGIFNAVAPKPVSNKTLTLQLAKKMSGSFFIPIHVPAFVLKIVLGEMSIEVLKSATVNDDKIRNEGFRFVFPSIEATLNDLIKK
ncbi:TIGR01777 family protein [Panacibacter ginsenosidivorans]|uniref:TIGR01777 family protein n=1 Tax=Panacibacter ginsenosidivorans TaxID=1813871 RepID=A0A5B8VBF3_9BACT|nr:TIGR01777 family oxidoreductase [Panacibacter ginsenosidivorans]QEC68837.1 TIGR01777 family protein [Panacibacter ginsenosidivorans]